MKKLQVVGILYLLLALSFRADAQTVLMEEQVNEDTIFSENGKNYKHYESTVLGIGMPVGSIETEAGPDTGQMRVYNSFHLSMAYLHKLKLNEYLSLVGQVGYGFQLTALNRGEGQETNRLMSHNVRVEGYQRINFAKRGNSLGHFIDIGGSAQYGVFTRVKSRFEAEQGARANRLVVLGPEFMNRFNYYAEVRLGLQSVMITGSYRFSDYLDKNQTGFDPPRINIGLSFDLGGD